MALFLASCSEFLKYCIKILPSLLLSGNMDSALDENALNDAEELLKTAEEKAVEDDVIVKKENESEDCKVSIDEVSEGNLDMFCFIISLLLHFDKMKY